MPVELTRSRGTVPEVARVFRCIGARRWDSGDPMAHVPPIDLRAVPGRWNDAGQYTLYTSHQPATAIQEKRRHLTLLSESIWDIEDQLARARAARAELMTSLQYDIRSGSEVG